MTATLSPAHSPSAAESQQPSGVEIDSDALDAAIARAHAALSHSSENPTVELASPINPQQLNVALKLAGWKRTHHSPDRYDSWQAPLSTREEADLIVPLDSSTEDYLELLDYAVTKLKFLAQRGITATQVLSQLKAPS